MLLIRRIVRREIHQGVTPSVLLYPPWVLGLPALIEPRWPNHVAIATDEAGAQTRGETRLISPKRDA